jgi:hypothetical protein
MNADPAVSRTEEVLMRENADMTPFGENSFTCSVFPVAAGPLACRQPRSAGLNPGRNNSFATR